MDDTAQEQTLRELVAARAAYFTAFFATVDEIEGNDPQAAMQAYTSQVAPALKEMLRISNALINRERERIEQQVAQAQSRLLQLAGWVAALSGLATGRAVGAEALVRWQHPKRGFVSPAEFVPFAEQTGYIGLVTTWMLDAALRTLATWAAVQPGLSIAVNVSTRDLQDPGFARPAAAPGDCGKRADGRPAEQRGRAAGAARGGRAVVD